MVTGKKSCYIVSEDEIKKNTKKNVWMLNL